MRKDALFFIAQVGIVVKITLQVPEQQLPPNRFVVDSSDLGEDFPIRGFIEVHRNAVCFRSACYGRYDQSAVSGFRFLRTVVGQDLEQAGAGPGGVFADNFIAVGVILQRKIGDLLFTIRNPVRQTGG